MMSLTCCFCCWIRCKIEDEEAEGRAIVNNMGMDLTSTERGASLTNIKKFPKFEYTSAHLSLMKEIGQSETCTICLGDYEGGEELRLLPCGHCFHAECIDAWLQINRICPMCKVDVYELYLQEEKKNTHRKKEQKNMRKKAKSKAKADAKAMKKRRKKNKSAATSEVMPMGWSDDKNGGPIPDARKFGMGDDAIADLEDPRMGDGGAIDILSPIELFRRRAKRLLLVGGGVIPESASGDGGSSSGGCGESKERLPEIEMSVLSSRIPTASSFMVNATPQRTLSSEDRAVALAQLQERRRASGARGPLAPIAPSMGDSSGGPSSSQLRVNLTSVLGTRLPSLATSTAQQRRRRRSTIREDDTLVREAF